MTCSDEDVRSYEEPGIFLKTDTLGSHGNAIH